MWWAPLIAVGASLLQNQTTKDGIDKATDAQTQSSAQQIGLARDIYADQRGLAMPDYYRGQDAANMLGEIYGIAPQSYAGGTGGNAFAGGGGSLGYTPGSANTNPTGEKKGGYSQYTIPSLSEDIVGFDPSIFNAFAKGGDVGQTVGNLALKSFVDPLGLFSQASGDTYGSLGANAVAGNDYAGYFNANADVQGEWDSFDANKRQRLFNNNPDEYAQWHYDNYGKTEGRQLGQAGSGSAFGQPQAAASGAAAAPTQANAFTPPAFASMDPMLRFQASPDAKLAQDQFLNFDTPALNNVFAMGGKLLSGSQKKALSDYGASRLTNAFGNYKSGLQSLAGVGQTAGANTATAGSNYGSIAGAAIGNQGNAFARGIVAKNDANQTMYDNIGRTIGQSGWMT